MRLFLLIAVAASIFAPMARAQAGGDGVMPDVRAAILHSLDYDDSEVSGITWQAKAGGTRIIPLAFLASAALPGLGQAYNRQWIKGAIAISMEAAVFTVWSITRSNGRSAERDIEAFAHRDWDPVRYSAWLNDYVVYLESSFGHQVTAPPVSAPTHINFAEPGSWSSGERATVANFFSQMQAIERQVFHPETGATFSHQIPGFGEQQYYELIGKYFQFAPGWNDYAEWKNADGTFADSIDPEQTASDLSKPNVSATFYQYAKEHAHSQDLLRTASRLSTLFVVNHLVAAIDAAVAAKLNNDRLSISGGLAYTPTGARPVVRALIRY